MLEKNAVMWLVASGWFFYFMVRIAHNWRTHEQKKFGLPIMLKSLAHPFLLLTTLQIAVNFLIPSLIPAWAAMCGFVIFGFGLFVACTAHSKLGSNYKAAVALQKPNALVTTGPYSLVRHPIYLGAFMMGFGSEIALHSPFILAMIGCIPLVLWQIKREEKILSETFPEEWEIFKKKTPFRAILFVY